MATTVLSFIGSVFRSLKAFQGDSFGILIASKDFPSLMQQINAGKLDKIPYITQIISSFMKMDCLDQDRVSALLYLKVNKFTHSKDYLLKLSGTSHFSKSATGSAFVYFLSSLSFLKFRKYHHPDSQYTTLHLSECMTVVNSYRNQSAIKMQYFFGTSDTKAYQVDPVLPILTLEGT